MTLGEMKEKVLTLIEEYNSSATTKTDDVDIAAKINLVINMVQNELARIKKIPVYDTMTVVAGDELELKEFKNFFQLDTIKGVDYEVIGNMVLFSSDGEAKIFYYKYPTQITSSTDDTYKFELSQDVLEIMPYGVAADLLKSDVSSNYGRIYAERYVDLRGALEMKYGYGNIFIEGGVSLE